MTPDAQICCILARLSENVKVLTRLGHVPQSAAKRWPAQENYGEVSRP